LIPERAAIICNVQNR